MNIYYKQHEIAIISAHDSKLSWRENEHRYAELLDILNDSIFQNRHARAVGCWKGEEELSRIIRLSPWGKGLVKELAMLDEMSNAFNQLCFLHSHGNTRETYLLNLKNDMEKYVGKLCSVPKKIAEQHRSYTSISISNNEPVYFITEKKG